MIYFFNAAFCSVKVSFSKIILIIEVWERFWYFVLAGQYGAWHPKKDNNL